MDAEDWLPWLAVALLASIALAMQALIQGASTRTRLRELTEKFWMFEHRLVRLDERLQAPPEPAGRPDTAVAESTPPEPAVEQPTTQAPEPPPIPEPVPEPAPQPAMVTAEGRRLEQLIVENWLVWLGGVALALGGAFLVKLSIDYGWLTPAVRVVLGVALGFFLSGAAEWVVRRDTPLEGEGARPSYIPQTLAAAGCATVFASLYAAYQLYALLPSFVAFPLLAAAAAATVALSLRHGPFVAALGLVGAFAVPLLVQSDAPSAFPLFAYLALVSAGSLAVLQYRAWPWLAWIWLGGAVFWVLLWLAAAERPETPVVGGFLLIQFGLFAALRHGIPRVGFLSGAGDTTLTRIITESAFWALAVAMF